MVPPTRIVFPAPVVEITSESSPAVLSVTPLTTTM